MSEQREPTFQDLCLDAIRRADERNEAYFEALQRDSDRNFWTLFIVLVLMFLALGIGLGALAALPTNS